MFTSNCQHGQYDTQKVECFQCRHLRKVLHSDTRNFPNHVYTIYITRQSLLSLHMTKSYVRTATRSTLKVEANLTQILNFKANFHTKFEPFFKNKIYANNGGHFKIVSIKNKIILST